MAEKEENIIFDFTWGNTYGLFGQGYHVMIKNSNDSLYFSYSSDLKYGEVKLDNAGLEEFMKDLKALRVDSWNGRTYSDSGFENEDTWRIIINSVTIIVDSKGANAYPPEWNNFLEYLHVKWSVPKSIRELSPEERKKIREQNALLHREEEKEKTEKKPVNREHRDHNQKNPHQGRDRHQEKKYPEKKEKREQHIRNQNANAVNNANAGRSDRPRHFRHRKKPQKQ